MRSRPGKSTTICLPIGSLVTPWHKDFCPARGQAVAEQVTVGGLPVTIISQAIAVAAPCG
jgi:hypothetical protein